MAQAKNKPALQTAQTEMTAAEEQVLQPTNLGADEALLWLPENTAPAAPMAENPLEPIYATSAADAADVYAPMAAETAAESAPAALQAEQILEAEGSSIPAWVWPTVGGSAALLAGGWAVHRHNRSDTGEGGKHTAPKPSEPQQPAPNHAPTDITLSANRLPENQAGAVVGKLTTTDPDQGDRHSYTVSDKRFEVVNGELKLKAGEKVDFAQEPQIKLAITTTDPAGAKYTENFILQVQDDPNHPAPQPTPNHAPTDITLSANRLPENQAGAVVGKLTTTDPDQGDRHSYTVSDARFEVVNGELKLKAGEKVDFAQEPQIKLSVTTTDPAGAKYTENFTLHVQDDPNHPAPQPTPNQAPTDITLSANRLPENKAGAVVGKLTTTDPDQGDRHSYTVSDARFEVVNGELKLKAGEKVDFAQEPQIKLSVTTTDPAGAQYTENFILQVQDDPKHPAPQPTPNQAPTDITLSANRLPENKAGAVVGKLTTVDPDAGDTHTYAVSDKRFEVVNGELKLKAGEKVDFAQEPQIKLAITTTDKAGAKYTESFTLQVQDDPNHPAPQPTPNHAPTDITLSANTLPENQAGAVVGKLATIDPDAGDTHTYTVSDARFEVVNGELKLKAGEKVDFAQEPKISLTVTTTDPAGAKYTESFTLHVQDDPAYPVPNGNLGVYVPKPKTDFVANVKDFGAKGDGKTDDTAAIQKAVDTVAAQGGGVVDIPAGTFMVNALQSVKLASNVIIRMGDDTVVQALPNGAGHYAVFEMNQVNNTHILGGTIVGDRAAHTGTNGEWGMGIRVLDSSNVVLEGVNVKEMWGDGIYVGQGSIRAPQNQDITVYQVTADHNRRQGISVTHGKNIKILDSVFQNTDGTEPRAGIDLEPNEGQHVSDVEIRGNQFLDNHIGFLVANNAAGGRVQNVVFENNTLSGNPRDAIILRGLEGGSIKGNIIHIDPDAHHHDSGGIRLYNGDYDVKKNPDPRPTRDVDITGNTLYGGTIMPRNTSGNTIADNQFKAAVFIRGNAQNGEELTAKFYDGDGTSKATNLQYQWLANGVPIKGATAARYTPSAADRGKTLTVQVRFTDNAKQDESAESAATPPVENIRNQAPTDITLSANRLPENKAGAVVGKLTTIDPDVGDRHSYTVSDKRFEVVNGELKLKAGVKVDFAQEPQIKLAITTTDTAGAKYTESFTLQVQDDPKHPAPNGGKLGVHVPKPVTDVVVNAKDFGAKGDGKTDDTAAIQKAIDDVAAKGGGVVDIPAGTYMVNSISNGGISVRSNVTVRMTDDTIVKAIPNGEKSYTVFRIHNADNAHILGGTIVGERDAHQGTEGEGGFGVWILSSQNVVVENVTAKNFWGDGFLVSRYYYHERSPENVLFYNVTADNNRRQGLSITDGNNIKVIKSVFKNTEGHSPESGIDIEPNRSEHSPLKIKLPDGSYKYFPGKVTNVEIIDSVFENNAGYGVIASANGDAVVENVRVINNRMDGNLNAITFNHVIGGEISGNTTLDDGRTIPYFDVDVYNNSQNIIVKDNTLYGGKVRTYEAGSLEGSGHQVSGNHTKAAVFIKGALKTGATVFAQPEDGNGVPLPKFIKYQWQINGKDIDGATAREYTIRPEDSGKSLSVRVEFPDGSKQTETAVSKPTPPIDSFKNNAAPTALELAGKALEVIEGKNGAVAGRVRGIDGDRGDDLSYRISDERFDIDAYGLIRLKPDQKLDYAQTQNIKVNVTAIDRAGNELSKPFTIAVKDDPDYTAPTPKPPATSGKLGVHVPKPVTDFVANAKTYGAKGDGQTDDTAAIQKAIDAAAEKGGGVVEIPAGTYMINTLANKGIYGISESIPHGLGMRSNVIVKMADDAVLKAIPHDKPGYSIFTFYKTDNAHIIGGTIVGDRDEHQSIEGQWGMGVNIISATNTVVENVVAKDFWGDGFFIGRNSIQLDPQAQNITLYNVTADHNRREGLFILDGKNIQVLNSTFKNTSGHITISGIDVEPEPGNIVDGLTIRGNRFVNNDGHAVVVQNSQYNSYKNPQNDPARKTHIANVVIEDNYMAGNRDGIWVLGVKGGRVANNTIHHPDLAGGPTGSERKLILDGLSENITVEGNITYGGDNAKTGGGLVNEGVGNTIGANAYKAAVYIRGTLKAGETLTAHIMDGDIAPTDGVDYQWLANGQPIAGAKGKTYVLTAGDTGKTITVSASFTDGAGQKEHAESAPSVPVGSPPENYAPSFLYLTENRGGTGANPEVPENQAGYIIGKLNTYDRNADDSHTYRVNDERFEIKNGYLKLKDGQILNFDHGKDIRLAIETTDRAGAKFAYGNIIVRVTDDPNFSVPNHAPTGITLEHASVAEKTPGAVIGKIQVIDSDAGDRHTFSFSDGRFEIENGYLKLKNGQALDYDKGKSIGLAITAKDLAGESHKEIVKINILDDGKPGSSAKMLKIQSEPELDLDNLERGTDGQDGFVIDGQGVKTLSGFNAREGDVLQLKNNAFPLLEKGTLADQAFTVGDKASSAEHRVIYNAQTGELAYDPDGHGAVAAAPIARLDPNLELAAQHIQII